jgi:hypothetical protein
LGDSEITTCWNLIKVKANSCVFFKDFLIRQFLIKLVRLGTSFLEKRRRPRPVVIYLGLSHPCHFTETVLARSLANFCLASPVQVENFLFATSHSGNWARGYFDLPGTVNISFYTTDIPRCCAGLAKEAQRRQDSAEKESGNCVSSGRRVLKKAIELSRSHFYRGWLG